MERLSNLRLFNRAVNDLAKICKVLGNPRHLDLLFAVADTQKESLSRRNLGTVFSVGESTVSEDLADLERVGLILRAKHGRHTGIQLTDLGKRIVDICRDFSHVRKLVDVSSDSNRLLLLEALAESRDKASFNYLHTVVNDLAKRSGRNSISTPLLSYHLRKIKEMGISRPNRKYYNLSRNGRTIHQKTIGLLSAIC